MLIPMPMDIPTIEWGPESVPSVGGIEPPGVIPENGGNVCTTL